MNVAVVIPVYKNKLSEIEELSLNQCIKILGGHDIIFASPRGLSPKYKRSDFKTEEFDTDYFQDMHGYNKLMLESHFYERFLKYDYILLHQLDAFVFRNELSLWCNKGYDYIGAPWIANTSIISKLLQPFNSKSLKRRKPILFKVGNGGLSLRKTKTFYEISKKFKNEINIQLTEKKHEIYAIEDVFWSLKVPALVNNFSIPNYKEALKFAIDRKPALSLKMNNNELPFGCHGFDKPKVTEFWKPIIESAYQKK